MKIPFVDLKAQYDSIKSEVDQAIQSVIADSAFIKGPYLTAFEEEFAAFSGVNHCIGVANGTDAIEIVLAALGIGPGDEVIAPANSFIATSEAITTVGAKVVFVDNHPELYTLDTSLIEAKITDRTKAIIPVHLYGLPADMPKIMELAKKYNLKVIEDSAQAHGAEISGKPIATFGDAATFSFFPGKNLGAYGDAGAITTNNEELATKCRMIANHGRLGKFDHAIEGRNSRLDGLQAAILSVKLKHLSSWTELRIQHAKNYSQLLAQFDFQLPVVPAEYRHVFHLYVVQLNNRDKVRDQLNELGVATGIHYPIALPLVKAYEHLGLTKGDFPVSSHGMHRILSLPIFPELTSEQMKFVVDSLGKLTKA